MKNETIFLASFRWRGAVIDSFWKEEPTKADIFQWVEFNYRGLPQIIEEVKQAIDANGVMVIPQPLYLKV